MTEEDIIQIEMERHQAAMGRWVPRLLEVIRQKNAEIEGLRGELGRLHKEQANELREQQDDK